MEAAQIESEGAEVNEAFRVEREVVRAARQLVREHEEEDGITSASIARLEARLRTLRRYEGA